MIIVALPASLCLSAFAAPRAPEQERDVLTTPPRSLSPAAATTPTARILAPEKARRVRS